MRTDEADAYTQNVQSAVNPNFTESAYEVR